MNACPCNVWMLWTLWMQFSLPGGSLGHPTAQGTAVGSIFLNEAVQQFPCTVDCKAATMQGKTLKGTQCKTSAAPSSPSRLLAVLEVGPLDDNKVTAYPRDAMNL